MSAGWRVLGPGGGAPGRGAGEAAGRRRDRGMVTVELAVGLLTLALMSIAATFVVSSVVVQTRCGDTASAIARQLARGDQRAADQARSSAPLGAAIRVDRSSDQVRVTVSVTRYLGRLGPLHLSSRAEAALEPGVLP